jgi:maltose alpha-D-glucosyltransferase/alpha-amylase
VLAFVRQFGDDRVLCVNSLSKRAQPVELDLTAFSGLVPFELLGGNEFPKIGELPYFITLAPYSFFWYALK